MRTKFYLALALCVLAGLPAIGQKKAEVSTKNARIRVSLNEGWRFFKYDSASMADKLIYDVRPDVNDKNDNKVADAQPTEALKVIASQEVLKAWILPTANAFIKDPAKWHKRPAGSPGSDFAFVKPDFNDAAWQEVGLPHDWAINGPFQKGWNSEVGGGMGRLPSNGVAWYRRKFTIPKADAQKSVFLEIEGAMSYAMVWLNGSLVGGWPYGYNSWQLDLTPYIHAGEENQLAIRIDNPNNSARWYPGGGIYRNMWLCTTNPVHIGQWGTTVTTTDVSAKAATINLSAKLVNDSPADAVVEVLTELYTMDNATLKRKALVAKFPSATQTVKAGESSDCASSVTIEKPRLWGPPPSQVPNLYMAVTYIWQDNKLIDQYETRLGVRSIELDPTRGIVINGEPIRIQGVNQHHDLGALGAAFNRRAAERQLESLKELGCNAIRLSHNPPAPELLELTDQMGFLVIDEVFDSWERKKTPHDFHLIFPDWSEADTRSFIRRDKNCPSVIMWSFGNEVGEQYTGEEGAAVARRLYNFVKDEDPTRAATIAMNFAKPDMPLPKVVDVIGLNYQGEGIRNAAAYAHLKGINTPPMYDAFHAKFPEKMVVSSETASALSTRGTYLFPVTQEISAPALDSTGCDAKTQAVSAYELYTAAFGSSADKVFAAQDQHPFVCGEFVWTGWDYLGEPTPYYLARSSYSGIIDLAGFKKDRFFLYQSRWRPELPIAHILPHWNWPERVGKITPVHVFTSGDAAELFLNGKSLGRKTKAQYESRLRWDSVVYQPGELKVVAFKKGKKWAAETVKTSGEAKNLVAVADRKVLKADGKDLAFVTISFTDKNGIPVPTAQNTVTFSIDGVGEIVATDNGNPSDLESFASTTRNAYSGLCLAIVRTRKGQPGAIIVTAKSAGLTPVVIRLSSK
ncbi:MAG: hypothetical protein RIS47_505 [Bacteroidota bacterium]